MKEFHYITLLHNVENGAKYQLTINHRQVFITYFDTKLKIENYFVLADFYNESDYNSNQNKEKVADRIKEAYSRSMKKRGLSLDSNCLDIIDESIKKTLGWSIKTIFNIKNLHTSDIPPIFAA